jgi:hypothetical protein
MGNNSNAGVTLAIFTFYTIIIIIMGLANTELNDNSITTNQNTGSISAAVDGAAGQQLSFFGFISAAFQVFINGIYFSLVGIPVWASILLFLPLGITILYLVLELAATAVP